MGILKYENEKLIYLGALADFNNGIVKIQNQTKMEICGAVILHGKIIYLKTPDDKSDLSRI
ncbi:MAG: hypothetical protein MZV64_54995 [Ignavibacteriales bacterium]|nr:hypothetical protein [Ignavibacteriales bacterium]